MTKTTEAITLFTLKRKLRALWFYFGLHKKFDEKIRRDLSNKIASELPLSRWACITNLMQKHELSNKLLSTKQRSAFVRFGAGIVSHILAIFNIVV